MQKATQVMMALMKTISIISLSMLAISLTGCDPVMNWFNAVGEHMPVIGERCEYWQCFTENGQHISEQRKENAQGRIKPPENPAQAAPSYVAPVPGGAINTTAPQ